MTPDDLVAMTSPDRDHSWLRLGRVFVPLVGREVALQVIEADDGPPINHAMAGGLAEILAVGPERWAEIAPLLHADAARSCTDIDYGFQELEGETTAQANYRAFGLNPDGSAPEGWAEHAWLLEVGVYDDQASLSFAADWEEEHGFYLRLQEDVFVPFTP